MRKIVNYDFQNFFLRIEIHFFPVIEADQQLCALRIGRFFQGIANGKAMPFFASPFV